MKIVYVAKHGMGDNDDEGAIAHALQKLGHEVQCVPECRAEARQWRGLKGDFLLFHKWADITAMRMVKMPKVFWYFDLVEFNDPTLARRSMNRAQWMKVVTPQIDLGFCTDGDWVSRHVRLSKLNEEPPKLLRLLQGADVRVTGPGDPTELNEYAIDKNTIPILFTGISKGGGEGRISFVAEMRERYGNDFVHVRTGCHQRKLANLIARSHVVVAPDFPITDHYWSNRVYLMAGFAAPLIHPYAETLTEHYSGQEIAYYRNRTELHDLIGYALRNPKATKKLGRAAFARTMKEHTYIHRCEKLIRIVKERLL